MNIIDKNAFSISNIHEEDDSAKFWRNKTYLERLEALEEMRRIVFGYDPSTERLQRTLTITKLKKN